MTEKRQVVLARRGQGKFRERVARIEYACRITGVNRPEHLIASHCKPWRDCGSNDERYLEFHREAVFFWRRG